MGGMNSSSYKPLGQTFMILEGCIAQITPMIVVRKPKSQFCSMPLSNSNLPDSSLIIYS